MTTTGLVKDRNLEKQIMKKQFGCMSGFLQIFDRQQLRIYSTKRLAPAMESSSESEQTSPSRIESKELEKQKRTRPEPSPDRPIKQSPTNETRSTVEIPAKSKSHLPISALEFKEGSRSSWKFSREAPRLSLDSRSTVDSKGGLRQIEARTNSAILLADGATNRGDGYGEENDKNRRSTSVVARLMGLEPLANPVQSPAEKSELRRSSSESRISRFVESDHEIESRYVTKLDRTNCAKHKNYSKNTNSKPESAKSQSRGFGSKKIFDSHDVFPDPKPSVSSIYGEIERRLRLRGIDEPSKDLETLKQILDALQLKGLLHSQRTSNHHSNQRKSSATVSPRSRPLDRRSPIPAVETASCRRNRSETARSQPVDRGQSSPTRSATGVKSPLRRKPLTVETERRASLSPTSSPKVSTRRTVTDRPIGNRSPRNQRPTARIRREEDEYSSISESSINTPSPSQTDTERSKDGRSLLERCDKLLLSIAEIGATELQPSPVSVLDSSFYEKEPSFYEKESRAQRSIDFKEELADIDDETWSPQINSDSDFMYISEIFRTSSHSSKGSDQFLVLEQQQRLNSKCASKASRNHRKLVFDTVGEILHRQRLSPPWKALSGEKDCLEKTWSEFRRIRERDTCREEDLFEVICGVLRKDLAGDEVSGWGHFAIEGSEAVLDIERLVFKDLVGEMIRDLAGLAVDRNGGGPRRKLVFF